MWEVFIFEYLYAVYYTNTIYFYPLWDLIIGFKQTLTYFKCVMYILIHVIAAQDKLGFLHYYYKEIILQRLDQAIKSLKYWYIRAIHLIYTIFMKFSAFKTTYLMKNCISFK